MGGSSLGAKLLVSALGQRDAPEFIFMDNIDPDTLGKQLDRLKLSDTVFYLVSKSGRTLETLAMANVVSQVLRDEGIREREFHRYCIVATEDTSNPLGDWAKKLNLFRLSIPKGVGGRYGAFTPTGLFPALFAGIEVEALLAGAEEFKEKVVLKTIDNPVWQMATNLVNLKKEGCSQTVLMPYSSCLKELSPWFVQLLVGEFGEKARLPKPSGSHRPNSPCGPRGNGSTQSNATIYGGAKG